jgi:hypothetical protein
MILDYLRAIRDIIVPTAKNTKNCQQHRNMYNQNIALNRILETNEDVINILKNRPIVTRKPIMYIERLNSNSLYGSGPKEISEGLKGLDAKLKLLTEQIKEMAVKSDMTAKQDMKLLVKDVQEIADTSIMLIKFLGDILTLNKDSVIEKLQEQIGEMVLALEKYL